MGTDVNKMMRREAEKRKNRAKIPHYTGTTKYELVKDKRGDVVDVVFRFGKQWNGWLLTDIFRDPQGKNYVTNFVLNPENKFPSDFIDNILLVLEENGLDIAAEIDIPW